MVKTAHMLFRLDAKDVLPGDLVVVDDEHRKVWDVQHWPDGKVELRWTNGDETSAAMTGVDGDAALQVLDS